MFNLNFFAKYSITNKKTLKTSWSRQGFEDCWIVVKSGDLDEDQFHLFLTLKMLGTFVAETE